MDKLIEILSDIRGNTDWENESKFIDDGLIDSFDIFALVADLNDMFGVEIELEHLTPENFNSVNAIANLLKSLGAEV